MRFINPETQGRSPSARKYCVLSWYVANTFFNDAYQTISYIQFIATGRVAPVTGYNIYI